MHDRTWNKYICWSEHNGDVSPKDSPNIPAICSVFVVKQKKRYAVECS